MADVIDLERFRAKVAADQGFRTWLTRFKEQFGPDTRLIDVSDATLLFLATPGVENQYIFFDLVMGVQGLGGALRFQLDDLEHKVKMKIFDCSLVLLDLARLEVMRRLDWLEPDPKLDLPLVTLVKQVWRHGGAIIKHLPALTPQCPEYETYSRLNPREQATFPRRLIPRAVRQFQTQVEGGPNDSA